MTTNDNGALRRTRANGRMHYAWHSTVDDARAAMIEQSTFYGYAVAADTMSASNAVGVVIDIIPVAPRQNTSVCRMVRAPVVSNKADHERLWTLAMTSNCYAFADGDDDDAAGREAALMLLSLEVIRRREVGHRDVNSAAMDATGEMFDRWAAKYGWRRDRRCDLAVKLAQLVVCDDNMHGQEAFWFAATARLFGATAEQIQAAAQS